MAHHIVGLDHTLVGVEDLEGARDTYKKTRVHADA